MWPFADAVYWPEAASCQRYLQNHVDPHRCLILCSSLPSIPWLIGILGSGPEAFQPGKVLNCGRNPLNSQIAPNLFYKNKEGTESVYIQCRVSIRWKEHTGKNLVNLEHLVALISQLKANRVRWHTSVSVKFAVKAGDPYWDRHRAFGKALFLLINIQTQSQAPPAQPLVTSGVLWARAADPSCILITYVFIQKSASLHSNTRLFIWPVVQIRWRA